MTEQNRLFRILNPDLEVPVGLHLVAAITGFTDAGASVQQLSQNILGNLNSETVAVFDNDQLLDYRSRRPVMFFEQDHIADYQPAQICLSLVWVGCGSGLGNRIPAPAANSGSRKKVTGTGKGVS